MMIKYMYKTDIFKKKLRKEETIIK